MTKEAELRREKKKLKKQIKDINEQLDAVLPNKRYTCPECNRRSQIKNVSIVHLMSYTEPHGCTGGDYWSFAEEYLMVCPKCNAAARAYDTSDFDNKYKDGEVAPNTKRYKFVKRYYDYFKEHLRWYRRRTGLFDKDTTSLEELREQEARRRR